MLFRVKCTTKQCTKTKNTLPIMPRTVKILKNYTKNLTSLSSSSRVNSFFLTTLSWLRKLNSAAFFCSLANLFSYLETFFSVGLTLKRKSVAYIGISGMFYWTYNLPLKSLTWLLRSAIYVYRNQWWVKFLQIIMPIFLLLLHFKQFVSTNIHLL